jgi:hypothetical protein
VPVKVDERVLMHLDVFWSYLASLSPIETLVFDSLR